MPSCASIGAAKGDAIQRRVGGVERHVARQCQRARAFVADAGGAIGSPYPIAAVSSSRINQRATKIDIRIGTKRTRGPAICQHRRLDHTSAANTSDARSEEHTSELQSLMRITYAVFCLKKKNNKSKYITTSQ